MKIPALSSRQWFLGIVAAGLTVLGAYGVVDTGVLPLWLTLASNILGVGVAAALPTGSHADTPADES